MGRWDTSTRRSRLPANWSKLRAAALKRDDHRCTWIERVEGVSVRCTEKAIEVDHHRRGDDHSMENLRSLCGPHHARKTTKEGHEARSANRKAISKRFRRTEIHPAIAAGAPDGFAPKWQQWAA